MGAPSVCLSVVVVVVVVSERDAGPENVPASD